MNFVVERPDDAHPIVRALVAKDAPAFCFQELHEHLFFVVVQEPDGFVIRGAQFVFGFQKGDARAFGRESSFPMVVQRKIRLFTGADVDDGAKVYVQALAPRSVTGHHIELRELQFAIGRIDVDLPIGFIIQIVVDGQVHDGKTIGRAIEISALDEIPQNFFGGA